MKEKLSQNSSQIIIDIHMAYLNQGVIKSNLIVWFSDLYTQMFIKCLYISGFVKSEKKINKRKKFLYLFMKFYLK